MENQNELLKKLDETNMRLKSIDKQLNFFYILTIISLVSAGCYVISLL